MIRFASLLLEVWREVGRHMEMAGSLERIGVLLQDRLPLELLLVRQVDRERRRIETLAASGPEGTTEAAPAGAERSRAEIDRLLAWCHRGRVARGESRSLASRLPGALPPGVEGELLAGTLVHDDTGASLLLAAHRAGRPYRDEHLELFEALLEPLAVLLENDRRLRELTSLREAAEADNRALLSRLGRQDIADSIVGADTGLRSVMEQIELVAHAETPVLILGETGTGKEVVARAIHTRSRRSSGPFLRVNCGAIPSELVDSELFGHERGSFTGAVAERKGWFERADGGTLFLDECGELPLAAQVRLLRILQDGILDRVGGERSQHVDVRIVAATHRDLVNMVADGRFRQDLWYRIAVFPIVLPPLRERTGDIAALAMHFALRSARRLGLPPMGLAPEDLGLLRRYPWPGNVRELAAVIERAAILGGGARLDIARALGPVPGADAPAPSSQALMAQGPAATDGSLGTLEAAMTRHIEAALAATRGQIEGPRGAAALLDINPHTLRARMRKLGIRWDQFRDHAGGLLAPSTMENRR